MILMERRIILVRRIMLWSALVGLFVSTYLLVVYVTGGPIVCGAVHGCDVVRASTWAKTVFDLPRPPSAFSFTPGLSRSWCGEQFTRIHARVSSTGCPCWP